MPSEAKVEGTSLLVEPAEFCSDICCGKPLLSSHADKGHLVSPHGVTAVETRFSSTRPSRLQVHSVNRCHQAVLLGEHDRHVLAATYRMQCRATDRQAVQYPTTHAVLSIVLGLVGLRPSRCQAGRL